MGCQLTFCHHFIFTAIHVGLYYYSNPNLFSLQLTSLNVIYTKAIINFLKQIKDRKCGSSSRCLGKICLIQAKVFKALADISNEI